MNDFYTHAVVHSKYSLTSLGCSYRGRPRPLELPPDLSTDDLWAASQAFSRHRTSVGRGGARQRLVERVSAPGVQ